MEAKGPRLQAAVFTAIFILIALPADPALRSSASLRSTRAAKRFLDSRDARKEDQPHTFLPDYDKLTEGKSADWVYLPGLLAAALSLSPAGAPNPSGFLASGDAKEADEPQKFLPDYDKLTKGKTLDWVYFPEGNLHRYKTIVVKEFVFNAPGGQVFAEIRPKFRPSSFWEGLKTALGAAVAAMGKGQ